MQRKNPVSVSNRFLTSGQLAWGRGAFGTEAETRMQSKERRGTVRESERKNTMPSIPIVARHPSEAEIQAELYFKLKEAGYEVGMNRPFLLPGFSEYGRRNMIFPDIVIGTGGYWILAIEVKNGMRRVVTKSKQPLPTEQRDKYNTLELPWVLVESMADIKELLPWISENYPVVNEPKVPATIESDFQTEAPDSV